ncbi:MAG: ATP-binding cassette domain-containing protein [Puniceicoccales bacterium]|jgi:ABC-type glutathione transport system ATPase component|nr:ATP-binding cassette domain-containing protein [Puniceicoccales bacterium]
MNTCLEYSNLENIAAVDAKNASFGNTGKPMTLVRAESLNITFHSTRVFSLFGSRKVNALKNVSFNIRYGESLGIVGESGSGKSTLINAIAKLVPVESGMIFINEENVTHMSWQSFKPYRKLIQIVFQDFCNTLNPHMTVGEILLEPLDIRFKHAPKSWKISKAKSLLDIVLLSTSLISRYPDQLSGGQRQRVSIARTLAMEPKLLICDEIVSALDVSVQAQILHLLKALNKEKGIAILFISHDIAVTEYLCDNMMVMKDGRILEYGPSKMICTCPQHPYTEELISSVPSIHVG